MSLGNKKKEKEMACIILLLQFWKNNDIDYNNFLGKVYELKWPTSNLND